MKKEFRVIVCGGRDYSDYKKVTKVLDLLLNATINANKDLVIIHGGARGADFLADRYARENKLKVIPFPADWDLHGKRAGPIRNQQMIDEGNPNLVIAFPGGRGTEDMVRRSKRNKIYVHEVPEKNEMEKSS